MRTQFSPQQLEQPQFAASEGILRRCVHCGFCTATCPTYLLLGDELDSPRGRIYLIKEMLEKNERPTPETVKHIDRCLSCLSCVTTCPSGVDYMHLIDHAREHIETSGVRPLHQKVLRRLLAVVLTRPWLLRSMLALATLARPVAPALPASMRAMLALAPASTPRAGTADHPQTFPAQGTRRARVALLAGCAQPVLGPGINEAAVRVLRRHGVEVVVARGMSCCGALPHHLGEAPRSHELAKRNIRAWKREIDGEGLDAIVITASGCGTMIKDYGYIFHDDPLWRDAARQVSERARDVSEFLATLDLAPVAPDSPTRSASVIAPAVASTTKNWASAVPITPAFAMRVAYQSPCSLHHGQQLPNLPLELLRAVGFDAQPLPEAHICCGSAGTYNLLQPAIAAQLRERKQAAIRTVAPAVVASGNIGCMTQLSTGFDVPIVHTVELIDWATGGPKPPALAKD